MSPTPFRALSMLVATLVLAACGGEPPPNSGAAPPAGVARSVTRPSQILITIEAFAGRRVVPFGGTIAMPRLAELVLAGTTYDDAVSTATLSRPALVTILTGVSPDRSGVRDNIHDALSKDLPTLAEGAKNAGYETAAFVSTPFASYSSGLQRGFELFDGPEPIVIGPAQHVPPVVKADVIAGHVKEWLASRTSDAPYFAWIHLSNLNGLSVPLPHAKLQKGEKAPNDLAAYDAALASIDGAIGAIVEVVRADPRSSKAEWTVAGTHGTYLGEGGRYGDPFWLANETLSVPVVRILDPGAHPSAARHDARPTWLPDVAATLALAMGVKLDAQAEGVPLEATPPAARARLAWGYALDDQLGWPPQAAVREGVGFSATNAAAATRPALPRRRVLSAEARAAIERAGLRLGTPSAQVPPKDPDTWLRDLQLVRRFDGADRPGLAARRSKILMEGAPDALASLVTRLYFFTTMPSKEGPALRSKLLARYPSRSDALHWAAHVSLVDKQYDGAAALLEAAMEVGPVEPEMYYDLACVRSLRGDSKGALAELDRALAAGYRNWDWIDKDPDLSAARADAGFPALLRTHGR